MSDDKIIRLGEKREHTPKADSEPKDKEGQIFIKKSAINIW